MCIEISQPASTLFLKLDISYEAIIFCAEGRRDSFDQKETSEFFLGERHVKCLITEKKERRTCFCSIVRFFQMFSCLQFSPHGHDYLTASMLLVKRRIKT